MPSHRHRNWYVNTDHTDLDTVREFLGGFAVIGVAGDTVAKFVGVHQKEGIRERLAVLAAFEPYAARFFDFVLAEEPRTKVSAADVLDALAAFVTSSASDSQLASLRGVPASDERGLPMEMLYVSSGSSG